MTPEEEKPMTETPIKLTPTQRRIMSLLADGKVHSKAEVRGCFNDELAVVGTLFSHMSLLRQRIEPSGRTIMSTYGGYRLVLLQVS